MARKSEHKSTTRGKISRRGLLKGMAAAGVAALAPASSKADNEVKKFDYVVVGSGPGGGPLACNLAKAGYTVCLLEAGVPANEPDLQTLMKVPLFSARASADPRIAWEYFVRHYADEKQQIKDTKYVADKKGILYPRASTIGGCGIHNASIMLYPSDSDWENIVELTGDRSWAPDRMRTYFERLEQCRYVDPRTENDAELHGFHGWQSIEMPDPKLFYGEPQTMRILESAESVLGEPGDLDLYLQDKLDPNNYATTRADREGLYAIPTSTQHGARWSVRDHILETAAAYPNLTVLTNCLVTRVLMDGDNTARGVEYLQGTNLYRASPLADLEASRPRANEIRVTKEVIISAGTFNSPQILKLSGIGSSDELSKHGIRTQVALPGVGTGMMDRYEVAVVTQLKSPLTLHKDCATGSPTDPCLIDWQRGHGIYTTVIPFGGLRKSNPSRPDRDVLIAMAPTPFQGYFPGWQNTLNNPNQFGWLVLKAHSQNRAGTVTLRSSDARDMPEVNFHYFEEGTDRAGEDLESVINAIRVIRRMNSQIKDLALSEVVPGPDVQSDVEIGTFVKNEAWGHHASCSNRMGSSSDPMAVVDSEFKVIGTRNLRVVDASVFPRIPGYFPMVPILMMSEKASDVILADARGDMR